MKLQLDTEKKTIKIEEKVNVLELFEQIKKLLPDGLWKEFNLEVNTIINWSSPIIIKEPYYVPTQPLYPHVPYTPITQPWITYRTGDFPCEQQPTTICSSKVELNSGIYNIEC